MKKVILIAGKINSGKNLFSDLLGKELKKENKDVHFDLFAKDVKDNCSEDFERLCVYINNEIQQIKSELTNEYFKINGLLKSYGIANKFSPDKTIQKLNKFITKKNNFYENKNDISRILLQIYGTDVFRNRVDGNYWIKKIKNRISNLSADFIIITDTRFPNEINEMYSNDWLAIPIKIKRQITDKHSNHLSETALDNFDKYYYTVDNNSDIETLVLSARKVAKDIIDRYDSI